MSTTGLPLFPRRLYAHCMPFHRYVASSASPLVTTSLELAYQRDARRDEPNADRLVIGTLGAKEASVAILYCWRSVVCRDDDDGMLMSLKILRKIEKIKL